MQMVDIAILRDRSKVFDTALISRFSIFKLRDFNEIMHQTIYYRWTICFFIFYSLRADKYRTIKKGYRMVYCKRFELYFFLNYNLN